MERNGNDDVIRFTRTITRRTPVYESTRVRQLEGMFDVPHQTEQVKSWELDIALDRPWNVGLIVGPSGSGKTTLLREMFGDPSQFSWNPENAVVDDFDESLSLQDISKVCQAVGFNTIPAWLRPFEVLSNGEQFRVTLARNMLETPKDAPIIIDEFTSVVDRRVAQIGSYAVAKYVRKHDRQFVAASCHYDIVDWLQPDWVLEPDTMQLQWRSVQPRPTLNISIEEVDYEAWRLFAPYHYLTSELNRAARCFVLFVDNEPAAFAGVLHRPHPKVKNIKGLSRLVTLPDWQGLGLAFVLSDTLGAAFKRIGQRFRAYPAHPALIQSYDRSPMWGLRKRPHENKTSNRATGVLAAASWVQGLRPNAVFEYVGPASTEEEARLVRS